MEATKDKARDYANAYTKNPTGYSTWLSYKMANDPAHRHDHIFGQYRSGADDLRKGLYGTFGNPAPFKRGKPFGQAAEKQKKSI